MPSQSFTQGQPHDRLEDASPRFQAAQFERADDAKDAYEITVFQRMLSATTGSLLTSLLGKKSQFPRSLTTD